MDPTAAHTVETAVRSTDRDTVRKHDMEWESNNDVYSAQIPASEYIQAPSSTREPKALEVSLPEWDPSRNQWIYRVSPTEIMSSRSEYRIDQSQISLLKGSSFRGGSANVVSANILNNQNYMGIVLAVKQLKWHESGDDDEVSALFANELQLLTELNHENIVKLVGFVEDISHQIAWLVFPWMANGNMKEFLASKNWEIPERISLLYDVACGVEYLHSRNPPICHGGYKSLDILVNADNRGLIADFGDARALRMAPPPSTDHAKFSGPEDGSLTPGQMSIRTQHQDIEGSPQLSGWISPPTTMAIELPDSMPTLRWAAPEVLREEPPALASDIWSFGWICWEAFTNGIPFGDVRRETRVMMRIIQGELPSLSEVSNFSSIPRLRSLIEDCWQLEPKNRPSATSCKKIISWMPRVIPTQRGATKTSPHLLRVTGDMYISASQISEGLKYITDALEIARANGDSVETALALLSLGRAHCIESKFAEAEEAFREAEALYARQGHLRGVGQAHDGLAQVYFALGNYDGAELSLAKAKSIFTQIGDDVGTADTLCGVARLHKRRCEFSKARKSYTEAQVIYARAGNRPGIAETTCGLAEIHLLQCEFDLAESAFRQAADIYGEVGDTLGILRTKGGLGDIFCQRGVPDVAESLYREALSTIEQVSHPLELANALYGLGHVYRLKCSYAEAARYFEEAEAIRTRIGDQLGAAEIHYGMGDLYRMQDEHNSAETAYIKARELFGVVGHHIGAADAMCGLAHVRRVQGRDVEAETLFNQAERVYKERECEMGVANASLGLAAIYIERLEYEGASSAITKALGFYTRVSIPPMKARALMMLALTHQIQEQIDGAMLCIKEAISIYSEIGDKSSSLACQELLREFRGYNGTATS